MDKNNFSDISAVQNNPQKKIQALFYIFIQQSVQKKIHKKDIINNCHLIQNPL